MPRVIISSGHTTANPGTVSNGLREVDVARKIAKAIMPHLRQSGVIALSVPKDLELLQRIDWINKTGYREDLGDIAIEVHINDGGRSGLEAWFEADGNNNSQKFTETLLTETAAETKLANLGAKSEYDHELGSLAFLHDSNPLTSLIECGFIDNDKDSAFLKDDKNIELMGKGIAKGILKYLNIELKEPATPQPLVQPAKIQPMNNKQVTPGAPRPQAPAAMPPRPVTPMNNPANSFGNPSAFSDPMMSDPGGYNSFQGGGAAAGGNFNSFGDRGAGGGFSPMPSREERKDMINKMYVKLLGREPNQNDLNYFLNIGITEDQLIKKMVDSQEHADLVKARQEVLETKQKYNDQQTELAQLRTQAQDQQKIIANLQSSIDQKNMGLADLQQRLTQLQKFQSNAAGVKPKEEKTNYRGTFLDKLFRAFSDLFE